VQDTVYYAMSRDLSKEDFKSWPGGFEELVDKYVAQNRMEILTPSDLVKEDYKTSMVRRKENYIRHFRPRDPNPITAPLPYPQRYQSG
jgi:hypothetical protein